MTPLYITSPYCLPDIIILSNNNITQNEQFLILPQCFQFYSITVLAFMKSAHIFDNTFSMSAAGDSLYVGKD